MFKTTKKILNCTKKELGYKSYFGKEHRVLSSQFEQNAFPETIVK